MRLPRPPRNCLEAAVQIGWLGYVVLTVLKAAVRIGWRLARRGGSAALLQARQLRLRLLATRGRLPRLAFRVALLTDTWQERALLSVLSLVAARRASVLDREHRQRRGDARQRLVEWMLAKEAAPAARQASHGFLRVTVRQLTGREMVTTISPDASVAHLKDAVRREWGIELDAQRLIAPDGRALPAAAPSLSECGLGSDGASVELTLAMQDVAEGAKRRQAEASAALHSPGRHAAALPARGGPNRWTLVKWGCVGAAAWFGARAAGVMWARGVFRPRLSFQRIVALALFTVLGPPLGVALLLSYPYYLVALLSYFV